jgi:hypothetical protein
LGRKEQRRTSDNHMDSWTISEDNVGKMKEDTITVLMLAHEPQTGQA